VLDSSLLFMFFSFMGGCLSSQGCTGLCSGGLVGDLHVLCDAHLFILPIHSQADLELVAVRRNGANFSLCSAGREGFA
jgi:hypothetical protein